VVPRNDAAQEVMTKRWQRGSVKDVPCHAKRYGGAASGRSADKCAAAAEGLNGASGDQLALEFDEAAAESLVQDVPSGP
jgi:hypothetical protein